MAFCDWLSKKTGRKVTLPTEAQWEWACRAGTDTPLSFGDLDTDFSKYANLADITVKEMAVRGVNPKPIKNPNPTVDFELKDPRSNDGVLHLAEVGSYQPNAWGLYDMHGNAAEWTRSDYQPYPYDDSDGRNAGGEGPQGGARRFLARPPVPLHLLLPPRLSRLAAGLPHRLPRGRRGVSLGPSLNTPGNRAATGCFANCGANWASTPPLHAARPGRGGVTPPVAKVRPIDPWPG